MRILFFGDIVGEAGRSALKTRLPALKAKYTPDMIIANGENAAHGFGLTQKICTELYQMGIDVITTGNHVWKKREILAVMAQDECILRPVNFPHGTPGQGTLVYKLRDGRKIGVVNIMGNVFMEELNLAFPQMNAILDSMILGQTVNALFIDVHAEATSEKTALAHYVDGRATAVIGTHTHVPTADGRILPRGTAFMSDAGMCGDYDSVIGMQKETPIARFLKNPEAGSLTPAVGEGTACGVFIESDDQTGRALNIQPIIVGPHLKNTGL